MFFTYLLKLSLCGDSIIQTDKYVTKQNRAPPPCGPTKICSNTLLRPETTNQNSAPPCQQILRLVSVATDDGWKTVFL